MNCGHKTDFLLGLNRLVQEAGQASGPEEGLWTMTRVLPSLLGVEAGRSEPDEQRAAAAFMLTPQREHHLICAPVNFASEQYHEMVAISLGHPGQVAQTHRPMLLRDTRHHQRFVKILKTFRAGSALFAPMLWRHSYVGTMICASSVPNTFSETDLLMHEIVTATTSSVWIGHGGPAWLDALDYSDLIERKVGEPE